jgi:hypothetical protein
MHPNSFADARSKEARNEDQYRWYQGVVSNTHTSKVPLVKPREYAEMRE